MKDEQKLKIGETGFDIHDKDQVNPITIEDVVDNIYITNLGTYEFYELVPKKTNENSPVRPKHL